MGNPANGVPRPLTVPAPGARTPPMAQFYTLEEAAQRLGIGHDDFKRRLKLEWTSIRPFRDGSTLRFRAADIDELARSLGQASDAGGGLPLGPVGSAPADTDTPLEAGGDDIFTAPASGKGKKSGSDSDVRLDLHPKASAADPDAALPTEEIALDLSGPGSSAILRKPGPGSSGKLSAPKSGANLSGPGSAKIPSPTSKSPNSPDSSSEFELSLDSDSDSFELQLTTDSSGEVDLGAAPPPGKSKSGQSGINLGRPSDSGPSLEKKKAPKSGPAKPKQPIPDDSDDFELSLEPTSASGTKLGGPKSSPKKPVADDSSSDFELSSEHSSSEFELTLEENSGVVDSLSHSLAGADASKGDIFETDFELPHMQDESGSEVVSVDETEASGFEVDVGDAPADDESGSQVVLVDEDAPLIEDDLEEGASASGALRGVRRDYDDDVAVGPGAVVVAGPAKWGPLPAVVLFPCVAILVLGGLMSFEAVRGMWGYHQPAKPGSSIVRGMADTFGMKTTD